MRDKKTLVRPFVLLACLVLAFGFQAQEPKEAENPVERPRSFLRMDLLEKEVPDMESPRRNVFAPGPLRVQDIEGEQMLPDPGSPGMGSRSEPPDENTDRGGILDLRYLGYILSDKKLVALVTVDGEAVAVEQGEILPGGAKVEKISIESIEITGSDSQSRTYGLEGESQ